MGYVRRVLKCDECGHQFELRQDSRDEIPAECPICAESAVAFDHMREKEEGEARILKMVDERRAPGRFTHKHQAMKIAESMMTDYGMTDFADGGRQGDRAAKAPSAPHSAEIQAMTREMVEARIIAEGEQAEAFAKGASTFWQAGESNAGLAEAAKTNPMAAAIHKAPMVAPAAAAQARSEGVDPVSLFHKAGKEGALRKPANIVASVKG